MNERVKCATIKLIPSPARICAWKNRLLSQAALFGLRRRSTLPGRLQPSTIDVLRLNCCVRYGNRWIPQAIATAKGELNGSEELGVMSEEWRSGCCATVSPVFRLIRVPRIVPIVWAEFGSGCLYGGMIHATSGSEFIQGLSPGRGFKPRLRLRPDNCKRRIGIEGDEIISMLVLEFK